MSKNKAITSRDIDFAKWYTDVVRAAHLADYSSVKGCIVIEPNGYAIWEKMQSILDKEFKKGFNGICKRIWLDTSYADTRSSP